LVNNFIFILFNHSFFLLERSCSVDRNGKIVMRGEELKIWKETVVVCLKALIRNRISKIQTVFVRPVTNTLRSALHKRTTTSCGYTLRLAAIRLCFLYEAWKMDKNSLKDCVQSVNTSIVFKDLHLVSVMKSQGQILRKGAVKVHSEAGGVERFVLYLFRDHQRSGDLITIFLNCMSEYQLIFSAGLVHFIKVLSCG
jgi:hypothetical protein